MCQPRRKGVELHLVQLLDVVGEVEPQLAEDVDAFISDELRRIEGAPERAPAIAAQLGRQQRVGRVLAVDGDQQREALEQRLHARIGRLDLGEVDAAVGGREDEVAILARAEALEATTYNHVELVDGAR